MKCSVEYEGLVYTRALKRSNKDMRATVKLISHASILVEVNGIVIITDPWFFGAAFNDGWSTRFGSRFGND